MSAFQQYIADREENLKNIVTYADNKAVDFFKMNKFEPKRLDQKYRGYVKHYNKSLLMMHTIGRLNTLISFIFWLLEWDYPSTICD